jgi:probable rRNA maturation factor
MPMSNTSSATRTERRAAGAARLKLEVQYAVARAGLPAAARFRLWARAALLEDASVTLRLVGEEEGRALNRDFRGRDYATNVLTFSYPESSPLSGDIALCLPVVAREAAQQRKTLEAHLAHLTVHGMLHLQGFDHERAIDAELMEGLETEIVSKLGYDDPYESNPRADS